MKSPKHLEMRSGQRGSNRRPTTGHVREDGERNNERNGSKHADGKVHVGDRTHAGDSGEDNDKGSNDLLAKVGADDRGEDEVENVAAADELITGNGGVSEKNGDHAEDAGRLVITGLKQIRNGELRELPCAWRDEVDKQKPGPAACGLPQSGKAMLICIFRTGKQRAGANP